MFLGTIAQYELRTTASYIDVFLVHIMLQIHDVILICSVLVENVIGLIAKLVL
jgi:hypothetical protein